MKLYEIDEAIERGFIFDEETGEVIDTDEAMDALKMEREEKVEQLLLFYKNLNAEAEMIKTEEKMFTARRRAAEKRAEGIKNYVLGILHGEKFKTARVQVTGRKSQRVVITDFLKIPAEFVSYETKIDKAGIKAAMKDGDVPGAELVEGVSWSIK